MIIQGYKLVATGLAAEDPTTEPAPDAPEVDATGWDSLPSGIYSFRYQDTEGKRPPLYLKCLANGPKMIVQFSTTTTTTESLELETAKYTTDHSIVPAAYKNTEEFVKEVDASPLGRRICPANTTAAPTTTTTTTTSFEQRQQQGVEHPSSRLRDDRGERLPPGILPTGVGYEDVVPPGVRPPGFDGGVGILEGGPPHMGGGMHVGPGHPMFGPGRLGGVGGVGGGGTYPPPPGGIRWDPIRPPGLPGFRPEDYQRGQQPPPPGHPHPDVMQPGPGRGTDWDSYFG